MSDSFYSIKAKHPHGFDFELHIPIDGYEDLSPEQAITRLFDDIDLIANQMRQRNYKPVYIPRKGGGGKSKKPMGWIDYDPDKKEIAVNIPYVGEGSDQDEKNKNQRQYLQSIQQAIAKIFGQGATFRNDEAAATTPFEGRHNFIVAKSALDIVKFDDLEVFSNRDLYPRKETFQTNVDRIKKELEEK